MSSRTQPTAIHFVIAVAGCVLAYVSARDLGNHISALSTHLSSGSWKPIGPVISVDKALRTKYEHDRNYVVSGMQGSSEVLDLSDEYRLKTIMDIGRSSVRDDAVADLTPSGLVNGYRTLIDLGHDDPVFSKKQLARAFGNVAAFQGAEAAGEVTFPVNSTPTSDTLASWNAAAATFEQSGRCIAKVESLPTTASPGLAGFEADVAILPRLVKLKLMRPWLDYDVIDSATRSNNPEIRKLFSPEGKLRAIPESVWVILPEQVVVRLSNEQGRSAISMLVKNGECCVVRCETSSFSLEPSSVRPMADGSYIALRVGKPDVYALVSRKRLAANSP